MYHVVMGPFLLCVQRNLRIGAIARLYMCVIMFRICSYLKMHTVEPVLKVTCEGRSPCIRRSVLKVPTKFSMHYIHIEHLYKQATCI